MFATLIVMGLIAAAILFGIFFLIFKVIWILFQSKRNFWPLILAGVATGIIFLLVGMATYKLYKRVVIPFQPIITAAKQQTEPVIGPHAYVDPQYGFSMTLYNGMVLSNWITLDPSSQTTALLGFDTNVLLENKQANSEETPQTNSFEGLFLLRQPTTSTETALQLANKLSQKLQETRSARGEMRVTVQPTAINIGPQTDAAIVQAEMVADSISQTVPMVSLIAVHENQRYYVVGFGAGPVTNTVTSFRLLN